jgi:hypothetical protein
LEAAIGLMLSGVVVAKLREQHTDYIVLQDGQRLSLAVGLVLEPIGPGTSVKVLYHQTCDGRVVVDSVERYVIARLPSP